jgi:hypothetical protein
MSWESPFPGDARVQLGLFAPCNFEICWLQQLSHICHLCTHVSVGEKGAGRYYKGVSYQTTRPKRCLDDYS